MIAWYWNILDTPYCEMTLRKVCSVLVVVLFIWGVYAVIAGMRQR